MIAPRRRPTVAIVYRAVFQYRRAFYEGLRRRLDELGIELRLVYGEPNDADRKKRDYLSVPWGHAIRNRVFRAGRTELFWQPCLPLLRDVDLVIVEQANKLLVNLLLLLGRHSGPRRLAFWGHGKDFQEEWKGVRLRDRVKRFLATKVDWWFAYNDTSKRVVEGLGFPAARITSVQNSIDVRELVALARAVTPAELEAVRARLGFTGKNTCVFSGGMYPEKRLAFLLEACALVREQVPDFEVVFVGAGSDQALVEKAAAQRPWIRHVGPRFDREKVPYFLLSKLLLVPGLVGLVVLDGFALGVPLVTTDVPYHSPEIEYLEHGVNGWISSPADDPRAYAAAVVRLLRDEPLRASLVAGCRRAAERYSIEEMVERFARGIVEALAR